MTEEKHQTHMAAEIRAIPALTEKLLAERADEAAKFGARLRDLNPPLITTIARGSSDHASSYLKYVIELTLGIPVASTGPSVSSVYGAPMHMKKAVSIAISQSGKSPDIVAMAETSKAGGSTILSLTNDPASPLAAMSDQNIDIAAGKEHSVAATKTFVLSIVAGLMVVAQWSDDHALTEALNRLPADFEKAVDCDWSHLAAHISAPENRAKSLYVLGRGPSYSIAGECALKFKETCQLHAEAYSAAEVLHGPVSIAQEGFTVLALASNDAARQSVLDSVEQMKTQGVDVFVTSADKADPNCLPVINTGHPMTDALVQIVTFYNFVEQLSRLLGLNPDEPPHLRKVTETV